MSDLTVMVCLRPSEHRMLQQNEFPFMEVLPDTRQLGILESSVDAQVGRRGLELF